MRVLVAILDKVFFDLMQVSAVTLPRTPIRVVMDHQTMAAAIGTARLTADGDRVYAEIDIVPGVDADCLYPMLEGPRPTYHASHYTPVGRPVGRVGLGSIPNNTTEFHVRELSLCFDPNPDPRIGLIESLTRRSARVRN